jgi:hypothetical protein
MSEQVRSHFMNFFVEREDIAISICAYRTEFTSSSRQNGTYAVVAIALVVAGWKPASLTNCEAPENISIVCSWASRIHVTRRPLADVRAAARTLRRRTPIASHRSQSPRVQPSSSGGRDAFRASTARYSRRDRTMMKRPQTMKAMMATAMAIRNPQCAPLPLLDVTDVAPFAAPTRAAKAMETIIALK